MSGSFTNLPAGVTAGMERHKRTMKVKHIIERVMNAVFFICGMVSIAAVLLITLYMIVAGFPAIKEIGLFDFLFGTVWQSTASDPKFGILPFVFRLGCLQRFF